MTKFHDSSISKIQRIAGYALSFMFSSMIFISGVSKVVGVEEMVENMHKITNWGDKVLFVGVSELVLLVVYWIPKSMKMGFYLLQSFVGGIIVAEVVTGQVPFAGIAVATFLYAGTILRHPSLLK